MNHPDAIVIGGGIVGLASARQLALRGLRVTLYDAGIPGREASWASGGMLATTFEGHAKPLRPLAQASQDLYADWIQQIEEESGIPIEFQKNGTLVVARSHEEMDTLEASIDRWERPSPPMRLSPKEIISKEPKVNQNITGGYFLPEDWSVNSRTLIQ